MNFDEFITKYLGKELDWDNFYAGQCVDLFRYYCNEVLEISQPDGVWGAANFWTDFESDPILVANFEKIANTPTGIPKKGDVVIWDFDAGGGFGHVAMFIEGGENSFVSLDQNWPTLSKVTKTTHNYENVFGWLRPKKDDEDFCEALKIAHEKLTEEHEKEKQRLVDCREDREIQVREILDLKTELSTSKKKWSDREKELLSKQADLTSECYNLKNRKWYKDIGSGINKLIKGKKHGKTTTVSKKPTE